MTMSEGEESRFFIAPDLAYGDLVVCWCCWWWLPLLLVLVVVSLTLPLFCVHLFLAKSLRKFPTLDILVELGWRLMFFVSCQKQACIILIYVDGLNKRKPWSFSILYYWYFIRLTNVVGSDGFCCNCWFIEHSAMVSGCFWNILLDEKDIGKPQITARNVMFHPLVNPTTGLGIFKRNHQLLQLPNFCFTSPHTKPWLMNEYVDFTQAAKMVRTKGCRCHPIPPWNMRFIFSKHHGLRRFRGRAWIFRKFAKASVKIGEAT